MATAVLWGAAGTAIVEASRWGRPTLTMSKRRGGSVAVGRFSICASDSAMAVCSSLRLDTVRTSPCLSVYLMVKLPASAAPQDAQRHTALSALASHMHATAI